MVYLNLEIEERGRVGQVLDRFAAAGQRNQASKARRLPCRDGASKIQLMTRNLEQMHQ